MKTERNFPKTTGLLAQDHILRLMCSTFLCPYINHYHPSQQPVKLVKIGKNMKCN